MPLVNNQRMRELMREDSLVVTPILDENQIGESSIDLRLGTTFKVSRQTRKPYICVEDYEIEKFFDETYREFGEEFILYPNQLVLANTFEFIKLPNNIMSHIFTRSSINRLGVTISSIAQPGYAGTLTLELINKGENAIRLKTGMRIAQLVLFDVGDNNFGSYISIEGSKYIGNINPRVSNICEDNDFKVLNSMRSEL